MSFKERLKYRWKYFGNPLPGETLDTGPLVGHFGQPRDEEKRIWKRRVRAVIFGYGPGWTMWGAIREWFWPRIAVFIILIAFLVIGPLVELMIKLFLNDTN